MCSINKSSLFPLIIGFVSAGLTGIICELYNNYVEEITFVMGSREGGLSSLLFLTFLLIVHRYNECYDRMWEARTLYVQTMTKSIGLATLAANLTVEERHPRAVQWRTLLKIRLVRYLRTIVDVISNSNDTVDWITRMPQKSTNDGHNRQPYHNGDPFSLATQLHELVSANNEYLNCRFDSLREIKLHDMVEEVTYSYACLTKFSECPAPFGVTHLTVVLSSLFGFIIPLVVFNTMFETVNLIGSILCSFLIVTCILNVQYVSAELDDPFGSDPNDLELEKLMDGATLHIFRILGRGFSDRYDQIIREEKKQERAHERAWRRKDLRISNRERRLSDNELGRKRTRSQDQTRRGSMHTMPSNWHKSRWSNGSRQSQAEMK